MPDGSDDGLPSGWKFCPNGNMKQVGTACSCAVCSPRAHPPVLDFSTMSYDLCCPVDFCGSKKLLLKSSKKRTMYWECESCGWPIHSTFQFVMRKGSPKPVTRRCRLCDIEITVLADKRSWKCPKCDFTSKASQPDFESFDGKVVVYSRLISNAEWKIQYWGRINKDRQEEILGYTKVSKEYLSRLKPTLEYIKLSSPENIQKMREERQRKENRQLRENERRLRRDADRAEKKEEGRDEDIESALGSSDFKSLFRFSSDSFYYPDGEKRATEGLVELLKKLRIDKPDEFNDIAKYIGSKAEQIQGDSKYSQLLSEFLQILFAIYPMSFSTAKPGFNRWIENSSSSDTIRSEIMKLEPEEFRRLIDCLPSTPRWKKSTWNGFANLLIFNDAINEENLALLDKLPFGELQGDSWLSYVVRKKNQSGNMEGSHSAGLVQHIRDGNRRVLCILSMSPADFSEFASQEDFSTIIHSPLFSSILSESQIRSVLEGDSGENYRVKIEEVIDKHSENSGRIVTSISTKFKKALDKETDSIEEYITLDKFVIQSWDYYDERVLQLVEGGIVAKRPLHSMDRNDRTSFARFSKSGEPIDDPIRIVRCITDFDFSFSDEVRTHLESLLMT